MLEESILANQNHPSVMVWSIGNELLDAGDLRRVQLHRRWRRARPRLDPTRPVGHGDLRLARGLRASPITRRST